MTEQGDDRLRWSRGEQRLIHRAHAFSLLEVGFTSADGAQAPFYLVSAPDWANVVAEVEDDDGQSCFVLVRQYRHGTGELTLEFPGGVVDPGESAEVAARRELLEEADYECEHLSLAGWVNPNPAFMTNRCYTFVAQDARRAAVGAPMDELERIDLSLVPKNRILDGYLPAFHQNAIMAAALEAYRSWLRS
jgi:8-oxo-dGTP pyrophosphatase MutT (NUDIX family)